MATGLHSLRTLDHDAVHSHIANFVAGVVAGRQSGVPVALSMLRGPRSGKSPHDLVHYEHTSTDPPPGAPYLLYESCPHQLK